MEDIFVEDYRHDTLIFIKELKAGINSFSNKKKQIDFGPIDLNGLHIYLDQGKDTLNMDVFIAGIVGEPDTLQAETTVWDIQFSTLSVIDSRFRYKKFDAVPQPYGMNYSDIEANKLRFDVSSIEIGDSIKIQINNLTCKEKGGVDLLEFTTLFSMSRKHGNFDMLTIRMPESNVQASSLAFRFDSIRALGHFTKQVRIEGIFKESELSFADLSYFAPQLKGLHESIKFDGKVTGPISNLRSKRLSISHGNDTHLKAHMNIIGLPATKSTFVYADIEELKSSVRDAENLKLPKEWDVEINLPRQFKDMGVLSYKGNLTGFLNDFVAYGTLSSKVGILSTDLALKQSDNDTITFRGDVTTKDFDLGKFLGPEALIGKADIDIKLSGLIDQNENVWLEPIGKIHKLDFNGYTYSNIDINGRLESDRFNGFVYISEPNIDLDLSGKFDFSDSIPVFDFNAVVDHARLDKLNLYQNDSLPELSFTLESNFVGDNFDDFEGMVNLWDLHYKNALHEATIEQLSITANPEDSINSLDLISSFADLSISGYYTFAGLAKSLPSYFYSLYPSFNHRNRSYSSTDSLVFDLQIKDTKDIVQLFLPNYSIGSGSRLSGYFDGINKRVQVAGNITQLSVPSFSFENINIQTKQDNDQLLLVVQSPSVTRGAHSFLQHLELSASLSTDSLFTQINWYHRDTLTYEGNVATAISFEKNDSCSVPSIEAQFLPGAITLADSVWHLNQALVNIDSNFIKLDNFHVYRDLESLKIAGALSTKETDTLFVDLQNIPLENINVITSQYGFNLKGTIDGTASLTNVYDAPIFFSNLSIMGFEINNKKLGNAYTLSKWDNTGNRLHINSYTERGKVKPFWIEGYYTPESGALNFDVMLDRFYLSIFEPFLEDDIAELGGIASNRLSLDGTLSKPVLTGKLKIQKAGFVFKYLNTRYNFTDFVEFTPNSIAFNGIEVYDTNGEKAIVTGQINHTYFHDFNMDIHMDATNFKVLNTRESDNSLYFGKAFASGTMDIAGSFDLVDINMDMKTEKGTRFFIPLTSGSEISENNFITFVNTQIEEKETPQEAIADLTGVALKMDLEVTPDAEVQLIFESKMGDIIKGNGNANLKIEISASGDFGMYGDYTIEKGEYMLTLGNLLSKRLLVKEGGTIHWNGDPYNANVNIATYYPLNASLQDLYMDSSEVYQKRVPVECQIFMTEDLMSPELELTIDLPKSSEADRAQLSNLPDDELNKQFISLLFINRFQPLPGLDLGTSGTTSSAYSLSESTSELLSNQLSHWLSQISNDFDIGFTYRPGNELTSDEVELALQTQLFNQRLTVNGNIGMGGQYENTNSVVGDVEADLKINESGKFRVKAFRRSNTNFDYEKGPTTQGVGIFYRDEFDTFQELMIKLLKLDKKSDD